MNGSLLRGRLQVRILPGSPRLHHDKLSEKVVVRASESRSVRKACQALFEGKHGGDARP